MLTDKMRQKAGKSRKERYDQETRFFLLLTVSIPTEHSKTTENNTPGS